MRFTTVIPRRVPPAPLDTEAAHFATLPTMSRPPLSLVGSSLLAISLLVPACRGKDTQPPKDDGVTAQAQADDDAPPVILP